MPALMNQQQQQQQQKPQSSLETFPAPVAAKSGSLKNTRKKSMSGFIQPSFITKTTTNTTTTATTTTTNNNEESSVSSPPPHHPSTTAVPATPPGRLSISASPSANNSSSSSSSSSSTVENLANNKKRWSFWSLKLPTNSPQSNKSYTSDRKQYQAVPDYVEEDKVMAPDAPKVTLTSSSIATSLDTPFSSPTSPTIAAARFYSPLNTETPFGPSIIKSSKILLAKPAPAVSLDAITEEEEEEEEEEEQMQVQEVAVETKPQSPEELTQVMQDATLQKEPATTTLVQEEIVSAVTVQDEQNVSSGASPAASNPTTPASTKRMLAFFGFGGRIKKESNATSTTTTKPQTKRGSFFSRSRKVSKVESAASSSSDVMDTSSAAADNSIASGSTPASSVSSPIIVARNSLRESLRSMMHLQRSKSVKPVFDDPNVVKPEITPLWLENVMVPRETKSEEQQKLERNKVIVEVIRRRMVLPGEMMAKYEIVELLGNGAFGFVFSAKILKPEEGSPAMVSEKRDERTFFDTIFNQPTSLGCHQVHHQEERSQAMLGAG